MPETTWTSQYAKDFRAKRNPRPAGKRVTSPTRRNNPHPIQDFLIYNRLPIPLDEKMKTLVQRAVEQRSKSANIPRKLGEIPVACDQRGSDQKQKELNPQPPPTPTVRRPLPFRPHTTVGPLIRNQYVNEYLEDTEPQASQNPANMNQSDYLDRAMAGNLSPRKHAMPPGVPGRSYTHYNGYAMPVTYVGALDLQAPNFTYATGHQRAVQNYTVYGPPPREHRPMHRHNSKRSSSNDYVHNHSIFTSTSPLVTGYYIIHPDWVSERFQLRRAKSLLSF